MAMEIFALADRTLNSVAEWQSAIDAEGYPLRLAEDVVFETVSGFLPALIKGKKTGFECDHWDPADTIEGYAEVDFGHPWKFNLAFRFGSRPGELEAAWMAATAYARATGGIVFDTEEGKVFTPDAARQVVARIESERPLIDATIAEAMRRFSRQP